MYVSEIKKLIAARDLVIDATRFDHPIVDLIQAEIDKLVEALNHPSTKMQAVDADIDRMMAKLG